MGRHLRNKLSAAQVRAIKKSCILVDGGGLRCVAEQRGDRLSIGWLWRGTIKGSGKTVDRRLGMYPDVSLEKAREAAAAHRKAASEGVDLSAPKTKVKAETFKEAFEVFFEVKKKQLRNEVARKQWLSTMRDYVFPHIGDRPVADLRSVEVLKLLQADNLWFEKYVTASRVLQRIDVVIDYAILREVRERANPCIGIRDTLGSDHHEVKHHRALDFPGMPAFMAELRSKESISRLCLEWKILTTSRSKTSRLTKWSDIDRDQAIWRVPGDNMKAGKPHTVYLSTACMEFLDRLEAWGLKGDLLFPSPMKGAAMTDAALTKVILEMGYKPDMTAHGIRASFKSWATANGFHDLASGGCMAHTEKDKLGQAYQRYDFAAEKRRCLQAWGEFLDGKKVATNVNSQLTSNFQYA